MRKKDQHILRAVTPECQYQCTSCSKSFIQSCDLQVHLISCAKTRNSNNQSQESLKAKQVSNPNPKPKLPPRKLAFPCQLCPKSFELEQSLNRHNTVVHPGNVRRRHKCATCGVSFTNSVKLIEHVRIHTGEKPYSCKSCGKRFSLRQSLAAHVRRHKKSHRCATCGHAFLRPNELKEHMSKHTGEKPLKCTDCDKRFRYRKTLQYHMRSHQRKEQETSNTVNRQEEKQHVLRADAPECQYECTLCSKSFSQSCDLELHFISCEKTRISKGELQDTDKPETVSKSSLKKQTLSCQLCPKRFPRDSFLTRHYRKVHPENPSTRHACSTCGATFLYFYKLTSHMRIHTGEKPYPCNVCGRRFRLKPNLDIHVLRHNASNKIHKCVTCGSSFFLRHMLTSHMKKHTGGHKCKLCDRSFQSSGGFYVHMRRHREETKNINSGCATSLREHYNGVQAEKTHKCATCGRAFARVGWLRAHIRRHTGEKPFRCNVCGDSFRWRRSLCLHMESHPEKERDENTIPKKKVPAHPVREHREEVHAERNPLECNICGYVAPQKYSLALHVRKHSGSKPYFCRFRHCRKRYANSYLLRRHLKVHDKDLHICSHCAYSTSSFYSFKFHETIHAGEKKKKGKGLRGQKCTRHLALRQAMKDKLLSSESSKMPGETLKDSHNCAVCSEKFERSEILWAHWVSHHPKMESPLSQEELDHSDDETNPIQGEEVVCASNSFPPLSRKTFDAENFDQSETLQSDLALQQRNHENPVIERTNKNGTSVEQHAAKPGESITLYELSHPPKIELPEDNYALNFGSSSEHPDHIYNLSSQLIASSTYEEIPFPQKNSRSNPKLLSNLQDKHRSEEVFGSTVVTREPSSVQIPLSECPKTFTSCNLNPSPIFFENAVDGVQEAPILKRMELGNNLLREHNYSREHNLNIDTVEPYEQITVNGANKNRRKQVFDLVPANPYTCLLCSASFWSSAGLASHNQRYPTCSETNHDPNTSGTARKTFGCEACPASFTAKCKLQLHSLVHSGSRPYKCDVCGHRVGRNYQLRAHMMIHTGEKPYRCKRCDKRFPERSHLSRHMQVHRGKIFKCNLCSYFSQRRDYLQRHEKKQHNIKRVLRSQNPGSLVRQDIETRADVNENLGVDEPVCNSVGKAQSGCSSKAPEVGTHFCCQFCDVIFPRVGSLTKHMRGHKKLNKIRKRAAAFNTSPGWHYCKFCSSVFSSKIGLKIHRIHMHTGPKPYKCLVCSHRVAQNDELTEHLKIHTGGKPHHKKKIPARKLYRCHLCDKRFALTKELELHCKAYHGDSFKCETCAYSTHRNDLLIKHSKLCSTDKDTVEKYTPEKATPVAFSFFHNDHKLFARAHAVDASVQKHPCKECQCIWDSNEELCVHYSLCHKLPIVALTNVKF